MTEGSGRRSPLTHALKIPRTSIPGAPFAWMAAIGIALTTGTVQLWAQGAKTPTAVLAPVTKTAPINPTDGRYVDGPENSTRASKASNPAASTPHSADRTETAAPAPAPVPAPQLTPEQAIAAAIVHKLKTIKGSHIQITKKETNALISFYDTLNPTLLWVTPDGLTLAAEKAMVELQNADSYGLDARIYKLPKLKSKPASNNDLADAELTLSRSVLQYARHAKGGRVVVGQLGLQLTQAPKLMDPSKVLRLFIGASEPDDILSHMQPKNPQFVKLREKLLELSGRLSDKLPTKIPKGPVLKKGMTHAQVVLLRKRLKLPQSNENAQVFDENVETAIKAFQKKNGVTADGIVGPGTRAILNGRTSSKLISKITINMERWRWLPENLDGKAGLHVWVNIPGLRVRVVKNGKVIFSQKAIVGQVAHKTPVFSDKMEWIEIHPTWFVPVSIKVHDILPSLRRPTSTVMQRYNLKVNCGKYGTDPKKIDWHKIDIRKCSFTQPAGPKSVLGDFKFKFPNKHSVYLHSTHKPSLFNGSKRFYSHGCVRVMKPRTLATLLLGNNHGMTKATIDRIADGPQILHTEKLQHPVPIHLTYFTALFDDNGKFVTRPDVYNYDARLRVALSRSGGLPPQVVKKRPSTKKSAIRAKKKQNKQQANWWENLF